MTGIPAAKTGAHQPAPATISLSVPARTSRSRQNVKISEGPAASTVPDPAAALKRLSDRALPW